VRLISQLSHSSCVFRFAWSPDGTRIAAPETSRTIVWDVGTEGVVQTLPAGGVGVAFSPDGSHLVNRQDGLTLFDIARKTVKWSDDDSVRWFAIAWCWRYRQIAIARPSRIQILDADSGVKVVDLDDFGVTVGSIAWSRDGRYLAAGSDRGLTIWDRESPGAVTIREQGRPCRGLAWSPDGEMLAVATDSSIQLLSVTSWLPRATLEGHTSTYVGTLDFSADGALLASTSWDDTVRLWRVADGQCLATIQASHEGGSNWQGVAFHPTEPVLATLDDQDRTICIWRIDIEALCGARTTSARYTTAKIALVGDGSVGKTTLGHRLIAGEFKVFPRTHGQQFWPFPALNTRRSDGVECEAIIWDLAGQADYRLTHALFVDDADLALILFNASDRQQPLKGVEYWLKALRHRRGPACHVVLVGAQVDTGDLAMTTAEIEAFCEAQGITGGYVATSALTGAGLDELVSRIRGGIQWDAMPATVTTETFKRIKEYVLELKSTRAGSPVPLSAADLRSMLEKSDPSWRFTDAEMMTAVGHLEDHGYVTILRTLSGESRILLAPDALINLTASIVLEARRNPRGLGALREADLLEGRVDLPELAGLEPGDRAVLLDAATALFLEHNVCFRERLGADTLLVFPSLIHQVKPESDPTDFVEDVSFEITGSTERLYAALVVLLGYTNTFIRTNQWLHQAQYETAPGEVCGFRQLSESEGQISIGLYYGVGTSAHTRRLFEGLFETFLIARDVGVVKYPAVACRQCTYRQERAGVVRRIRENKAFIICAECGERIDLPKPGELSLKPAERHLITEERSVTQRRTSYETALARVKGLIRDRGSRTRPVSCFVSYAWGDNAHERWVAQLVGDLLRADIDVVFDQRDSSAIGVDIARFMSDGISRSDFVAVVGTPRYLDKYENLRSEMGTMVAAEVDLVHQRLTASEARKATVLPLLRAGERDAAFPPMMRGKVCADFRDDERYFATLMDLVLTLHGIRPSDPAIEELRASLARA
jgi:small GTP-binding protein